MTYEYINVSGAKPKLYNLPPSMTKRKENREKPSGDASARLTNKGPAKLVPCWEQTRQKEKQEWKFRVKTFIACMCAAIRVWSAVIITTIWGLVQRCPPHNKDCWRCVHAVTGLRHGHGRAGFAKHYWWTLLLWSYFFRPLTGQIDELGLLVPLDDTSCGLYAYCSSFKTQLVIVFNLNSIAAANSLKVKTFPFVPMTHPKLRHLL